MFKVVLLDIDDTILDFNKCAEYSMKKAAKDFNIALETLINGVPNPTYIIRRNDFINVLVTVSYNENYNTIDFHVTDWTEKEGNVEFN